MSAEIEAGAGVGRAGLMGRLQAQLSDGLREGTQQASAYAERICSRLDIISAQLASIAGVEEERTTAIKAVAANSTEQLQAGRPGYMGTIERIAITADAATTVDIFVGSESDSGFRHRVDAPVVGASRVSVGQLEIDVPEGAAIFARAGAGAARVNLQVKRQHV
jgi:hypothetical protein